MNAVIASKGRLHAFVFSCLFYSVFCPGVVGIEVRLAHSATPSVSGHQSSDAKDLSGDKNITPGNASSDRYSRKVKADFNDVFADLEFAITEKNYRITGVNSIGRAITDRGDSPFPLASVVHFCNIEAAKEILEISMDYLLLMPCRITLNEIDSGFVVIEAQLLPVNDKKLYKTALRVNAMLREIVDFAAGDW